MTAIKALFELVSNLLLDQLSLAHRVRFRLIPPLSLCLCCSFWLKSSAPISIYWKLHLSAWMSLPQRGLPSLSHLTSCPPSLPCIISPHYIVFQTLVVTIIILFICFPGYCFLLNEVESLTIFITTVALVPGRAPGIVHSYQCDFSGWINGQHSQFRFLNSLWNFLILVTVTNSTWWYVCFEEALCLIYS